MKKRLLSLLSLLLVAVTLCSMLAACGPKDENPDGNDPDEGNNPPATEEIKLPEPGTTEGYMPDGFFEKIATLFEEKGADFSCLTASYAPYTVRDSYTFGAGRVHKISLPVYRTMTPDDRGDYLFTVYLIGSSRAELSDRVLSTYELKINGEANRLEPNSTVFKYVTVDVYDLNITLAEGQTLAFVSPDDTIQVAFLHDNLSMTNDPAMTLYKKEFGEAMCTFSNVASTSLSVDNAKNAGMATLMFDIAIERLYKDLDDYKAYLAEKKAYEDMITALKTKYAGKTYSVIGDSISTYEGVNNNADYNSTIGGNNVYYNDLTGDPGEANREPSRAWVFDTWLDTYWGRMTREIGMELCVNNSWSGSYVYDKRDGFNPYPRANQLHQDGGTPNDPSDDVMPDVIFIFLGTNDYIHNTKDADAGNYTPTHFDETLFNKLKTAKNTNTVIENFVKGNGSAVDISDGYSYSEGVFPYADAVAANNAANTLIAGKAFLSWQAGYALLLRKIQQTYPNAELVCLTLPEFDFSKRSEYEWVVPAFNTCITAIAEYFGATVVHSENVIYKATGWAYFHDESLVHPNISGHKKLFEEIARTMYAKTQK